MVGKRGKQLKPRSVVSVEKSAQAVPSALTYYHATALIVALVAAFSFSNYNNSENARENVTMSMLRPSELSEEELVQVWRVDHKAAQVDRVPITEMTHEKFRQEYLAPRKPVVLEGAYASSPLTDPHGEWSFQQIRELYGDVQIPSFMVPPQKGNNSNCSFAGLCKKDGKTLGDLFDETFLRPVSERRRWVSSGAPEPYPHDLHLQHLLPDMYKVYRKLSYFTENLYLTTVRGLDKWPSLFFGAAGTRTGLHVDFMGTSFTMAVFQGKKQFVLFPASDAKHLCMDTPIPASRYGIDVFHADFSRCPNALKSSPLFATLGPGDILYVPGSTPHAARNLEDGIGIGQNFHTTGDYVSLMESGPTGYDATQARKNNQETGRIDVEPEFFALRDLFLLLKETGYQSDWSNEALYLEADESRSKAHERVLQHLERALEKDPKLSSRIAFLVGNRPAVLAMKAAGIWDCLDEQEREHVFEKPHGFHKDDTRNRLHATFQRFVPTGDDGSWCQKALQAHLNVIEAGVATAGKDVFEEKTLSSYPSSWPKSRYLQ